jgi:RimJ/RimL family protein N-acetyltransferase
MKTFQKYGITLERLSLDTIELVRNWRNDPKISKYMVYQDYITPEMQLQWFNKINNDLNYFWIAKFNDEDLGLVNIKNIDYEKKCGETGIFIYNDKYLNSDIPFRVSLCNHDFIFEKLNLEFTYGPVLANNKRAIRFGKAFGCEFDFEKGGNLISVTLTKERYFEHRDRLIRLLPKNLNI